MMVSDLDALLAQGTLQALFQPIIDGVLRRPIGYEALARGPVGHWMISVPGLRA
jgi:hypothetical protein